MKKITLKTRQLFKCQYVLALFIAMLSMQIASAQQNTRFSYATEAKKENANYFEIVAKARAEFAKQDLNARTNSVNKTTKAIEKEKKQFERWAYLWRDKINADGSFPTPEQRMSQNEFRELLTEPNTSAARSAAAWTQVGPANLPEPNGYASFPGKGRINVVAIDPTNENTMYAGAPVGGIWKTTDNGVNWTAKSDNLAGLGVSDILIDPNNTNIIYMATGDKETAGQAVGHISSIGLYKSTDGGDTWNITGLTANLANNSLIRDIAFLPGSSTTLFATFDYELRRSTDSGATWTTLYTLDQLSSTEGGLIPSGLNELIFDPNDATKMVLSSHYGQIIYSSDSGANWTIHSQFSPAGRNVTRLATTPNDTDHFYLINMSGQFMKVRFNLTDTASDIITSTSITGYNSQQGFNMPIAVSPTNKNIVMVGGVRSYLSTNGGTSFSIHTNPYNDPPSVAFYTHPDHHYFGFKSDGTTLVNGHDGGVSIGPYNATSNSGSGGFIDVSAKLNITQSYNIAVTQETNGDNFMMANQDNDGFSKVIQNGTSKWVSAEAGDGTSAAINKDTPNIRFLGGTVGTLYRATTGWSTGSNQASQILSGGDQNTVAFVSPMKLDPADNKKVYACFGDILHYDETSGANYTGDISDFTALNSGLTMTRFIDIIHNSGTSFIYTVGTNTNGESEAKYYNGTSWATIAAPSGQTINSISTRDNATIYCTVSGYNSGSKIYKSTNFGTSWTNISTGLPNIIMKKMLVKTNVTNETLFVATELGVYWKNNTMSAFTKLGTGLPNVRVDDLEINYTDELLYIGTFGRGMFRTSVSTATLGTTESVFSESKIPSIYPNPATSVVNIKVPSELLNSGANLDYVLYNSVGAILKSGTLTKVDNQISVNRFSTGIYMMRISDGNAKNYVVKKLIIK